MRDAAAFLDVIAGYEPGDAHWAPPPERPFLDEVGADPGRLRIAFTAEPAVPYDVDPRLVDVTRRAADALAALGHDVVERTPPWVDEQALGAFAKLWQLTPALYPVGDPSLLMPLNRALAEAAHATSSVVFAQAVGALQRAARRIVAFWDDVDVVLTPALAKLPVPIGWVFEPDGSVGAVRARRRVHAVHADRQRHGPAGGRGAVRRRRRAAGRDPADRPARRRGAAAAARRRSSKPRTRGRSACRTAESDSSQTRVRLTGRARLRADGRSFVTFGRVWTDRLVSGNARLRLRSRQRDYTLDTKTFPSRVSDTCLTRVRLRGDPSAERLPDRC